jgi:hypothetical protein
MLGIVTIVGSGGGFGLPGFPEYTGPGSGTPTPLPLTVKVTRSRLTVQAGGTATFQATAAYGATSYQWLRDGVDIAGATGLTYTLTGAGTGDDGAQFTVVVQRSGETATATALLRVSPLPGVAYQDSEFRLPDWSVLTFPEQAPGGPKVTVAQQSGYRSIVYEMMTGFTSVRAVHTLQSATYDPAAQGAILVIDYQQNCIAFDHATGTFSLYAGLMLEQGGRAFVASSKQQCRETWAPSTLRSLRADEFLPLIDAYSELRPDFSAGGAPIRLGFFTEAYLTTWRERLSQGVDDWKVTVWRR